jgi:hypothetical protein
LFYCAAGVRGGRNSISKKRKTILNDGIIDAIEQLRCCALIVASFIGRKTFNKDSKIFHSAFEIVGKEGFSITSSQTASLQLLTIFNLKS